MVGVFFLPFLNKNVDTHPTLCNIYSRMNEITKKGRGRPRGATSTVEMKLSDIIDYVDGDMDATIQVGRTWLNQRTPVWTPSSERVKDHVNPPSNDNQDLKSEKDTREDDEPIEFVIH